METPRNIDRLLDVEMNVTVRFGRTELPLREVVGFGVGSMLELNRTVDEPVELLVNNYPFARGEVVVVDGYYGVRVTEIGSADERSRSLFPLSPVTADAPAESPAAEFAEIFEQSGESVDNAAEETPVAEETADAAESATEESEDNESPEETMEEQS